MSDPVPPRRPTSAGMYDYYLGGTAYSPADQAAGSQVLQILPEVSDTAWANRGFLQRAVRWLAAEQGIRQFLDVGAGLPTQRNTHDVVAEAIPDGRVVYVDLDPVVVTQAQKLLDQADGAVALRGDIRSPDAILAHPETQRLIDFTAPVGLLLVAVLHFVPDDDDPWRLVERYLDAVPSGSYLVLSHGTTDNASERNIQAIGDIYKSTPTPPTNRSKTEVERFFRGLTLVPPYRGAEPGVAFAGLWGAEDLAAADSEGARWAYAAVARKP